MNNVVTRTYKSIKLFPWQKEVVMGILSSPLGSIHTVISKRQTGKSIMIEQLVLGVAINKNNSISMVVSPTISQARKIYNELLSMLKDKQLIFKKNDSLLEIVLINKSTIMFKSAEQREALRGFTLSGILCIDEAAFIRDDIFYTLLPTTDVHQVPILIVSTPKFKQGFFYDFLSKGLSGVEGIYSYSFNNYDTSKLLSNTKLDFYRSILPSSQFKTEYLGEFLDTDSVVFGNFKCNIAKEVREIKPTDKLYVGIDWGTGNGNDSTAISILNGDKQQVLRVSFNTLAGMKQIDRIMQLLKPHLSQIEAIVVEKNSIGGVFSSMLSAKLNAARWYGNYVEFVTTNSSKARLIQQLQVDLQNKGIELMDDNIQTNELSFYEVKVNPSTNCVSYNAPSGMHDDTVIGLLLSLEAIKVGEFKFSVS